MFPPASSSSRWQNPREISAFFVRWERWDASKIEREVKQREE
jgi:hypothetical protein